MKKKKSPGVLHQEEQVIMQMLLPNGINGLGNREFLKVSKDMSKGKKKKK